MVGAGLQKTVHGVEGVAGERGRHLPGVVGLVDVLVHQAVVQEAVNPVDAGVSESDEGEAAQHNAAPTCQSQTLLKKKQFQLPCFAFSDSFLLLFSFFFLFFFFFSFSAFISH